ncbi:hypothetical protein SAMN04488589_0880 [Methanolobus vulcani]|uniref:Uncharacterized protein n=1 Tax=Methanolobus vulcani TaxID=38026 RepID=A0A7Z7AYT6_9EURY|nr:hypothetical protein [Methanolobus vulcani]SDF55982.1 hypothetical protein SAMN04488589_0880 [Methanolobus vulcani]
MDAKEIVLVIVVILAAFALVRAILNFMGAFFHLPFSFVYLLIVFAVVVLGIVAVVKLLFK